MAQLVVVVTLETDLYRDAVADLERIFRALAKRHGSDFRELEGRIERIIEGEHQLSESIVHSLGDGIFVAEPPSELTSIIRSAHKLGVI